MKIQNPILTGFHPDPSILRVGDDYYLATSTFEWYPGVQIYHSRDLGNWELIAQPLTWDKADLTADPDSGGIWAPCLSHDGKYFYLVYTDVKSFSGIFKDTHNYLIYAEAVTGDWSAPVYLNSSGFDPSLFHDQDGKKWLLNMVWDYRSWKNPFGGIVLQEYDDRLQCLTGDIRMIFKGTDLGFTEGPHIYRRNGYYYLMTAEGGTSYTHAVTLARSRTLRGPYEICPWNPILTSTEEPSHPLQKAGHGSLVEGVDGSWYLAHLCGRPLGSERRCVLGRETCLEKVMWQDDWLVLMDGGKLPSPVLELTDLDSVLGSELITSPNDTGSCGYFLREDFDHSTWSMELQSLRRPLQGRASLSERRGYLRLYGGESLSSHHSQSLLACRQREFGFTALTKIDFHPHSFQHMAGLIYYYDTLCYYYLYLSQDEELGRVISVLCCDLGKQTFPVGAGVPIPPDGEIWLKLEVSTLTGEFSYSLDGKVFHPIGNSFDVTILSDDYYAAIGESRFTGAFTGICCQDLSGQRRSADFDFFEVSKRFT